jgi:hypothetical protein
MMANDSPVSEVMVKFPSPHWNKETSLINMNSQPVFQYRLTAGIVNFASLYVQALHEQ